MPKDAEGGKTCKTGFSSKYSVFYSFQQQQLRRKKDVVLSFHGLKTMIFKTNLIYLIKMFLSIALE